MRNLRRLAFFLTSVLVVASAAQLRQVAIIDIPGRPGFDTLAWADGKLVIAHRGADKVDIFDPAKRRIIAQVTDIAEPRGLAVDAQAGKVYVASAGSNALAVIDVKTWKLENKVALDTSPNALLLVPGGKLYVSNWRANSVSVVDPAQGGAGTKIDVGGIPEELAWDPGSRSVFVSVQDQATVAAIGPDNQVTKRFKLRASQPTGLAIDVQQRRLFVAVRFAVLVLNADNGEEIARIPAAGGTDTLWFDESNRTLYAADSGGSVNMIATDNNRFISEHELKTQVRGHTLAFDPQKKMVYMPGGREGRSKLVILKRVESNATAPANAKAAPSTQGAAVQPGATVADKR
ncbi:MAG TPA: YncE family protein [Terriglobales bacterium]|jgi:YVTN family beta-propeller protein|nr:YncE family protein [Terriglobales bacterium]